jgi:hypothetical protein
MKGALWLWCAWIWPGLRLTAVHVLMRVGVVCDIVLMCATSMRQFRRGCVATLRTYLACMHALLIRQFDKR